MTKCRRLILYCVPMLVLSISTATPTLAQDVSVPDPGLNAAVRQALQKPLGPLTEQDMLRLTDLNASGRNISSVTGLDAARNLAALQLFNNRLTNFALPSGLTNLSFLDVSANPLTNCSLPSGLTHLEDLVIESTSLSNLTLPSGLTALIQLDLTGNRLTRFTVPADMTNLVTVHLGFNQVTNLTLPPNLTRLGNLDLSFNRLRNVVLPAGLTNLGSFFAGGNQLTNLTFPADMRNLRFVDISDNQLANLTLPTGLNRLNFLRLAGNELTSFTLPAGLTNLTSLFLQTNRLTNLLLPPDLIHLIQLDVRGNNLTSLTLPPDMTQLTSLVLDGNPLTTLVLPEPLASTRLSPTVAALRTQGVSVFTYPLTIQLIRLRQPIGAFQFAITGPPGDYTVLTSSNLVDWNVLRAVSNPLGSIVFTDVTAHLFQTRFYRALLQSPPTNMAFIPPNTFLMGSPTSEQDRQANEGPQTTVTLTRGFWIGKYEVTQAEYLSVMNMNPSPFPGDLSRPVSGMSWPDATNYCAKLTQRELAAGLIAAGSQYRLPTEAEWECAARAGTSTRFSYGDDPDYTSLRDHSWYASNSGLTAHPVGQKLPNPWGLYDMEGNVVEWCQDWFGLLPGGVQTDPTGPASSVSGRKVVRGGAFDNTEQSCRSASRLLFPASLGDTDLGFRVVLVTGP